MQIISQINLLKVFCKNSKLYGLYIDIRVNKGLSQEEYLKELYKIIPYINIEKDIKNGDDDLVYLKDDIIWAKEGCMFFDTATECEDYFNIIKNNLSYGPVYILATMIDIEGKIVKINFKEEL